MKSLILIPSYLWKNTLKRWFENPISPLSKILVPSLLGLLATLVLVFFAEAEAQLKVQLAKGDSYAVHVTETHKGFDNSLAGQISLSEEEMWQTHYREADFNYIRQPLVFAEFGMPRRRVPVVVYNDLYSELSKTNVNLDIPTIWFLCKSPELYTSRHVMKLGESSIVSTPKKISPAVLDNIKADRVLAIPLSMGEPILKDGFTTHMLARFKTIDEVAIFVAEVEAYYKAEHRNIRVFSALEILSSLEKIQQIQNYIRLGIITSCGLILALILGTIAWLEYRQESYLLALLRSFGTPRFVLIIHFFFENLLLVAAGILIAFEAWKPIYDALQSRVTSIDLRPASSLVLPNQDASIILISGLLGVLVAMIPIAFGLRKPAGLILQ